VGWWGLGCLILGIKKPPSREAGGLLGLGWLVVHLPEPLGERLPCHEVFYALNLSAG